MFPGHAPPSRRALGVRLAGGAAASVSSRRQWTPQACLCLAPARAEGSSCSTSSFPASSDHGWTLRPTHPSERGGAPKVPFLGHLSAFEWDRQGETKCIAMCFILHACCVVGQWGEKGAVCGQRFAERIGVGAQPGLLSGARAESCESLAPTVGRVARARPPQDHGDRALPPGTAELEEASPEGRDDEARASRPLAFGGRGGALGLKQPQGSMCWERLGVSAKRNSVPQAQMFVRKPILRVPREPPCQLPFNKSPLGHRASSKSEPCAPVPERRSIVPSS